MKKACVLITCLVVLLMASGCAPGIKSGYDEEGNLYGRVSISGAWAMYPLVVRWAEEFRKEHPKVQIDISAGGAGKGMADALVKMVDLAMVSRDITPAELSRNAWYVAVAKDAVIPTFNSKNPSKEVILRQGLTRSQFQAMFLTGGAKNWSQFLYGKGEGNINVYTRSDACGAAEIWAYYLGKAQEDLMGIGVYGDPGIADIVKNDVNGVGYNNIAFAYDINTRLPFPGLAVIPLDLNENGQIDPWEDFYGTLDELMEAIVEMRYPSPPARNLYFVSNGPPENVAAVEFLQWILTHGQAFTGDAGYVGLSEHMLNLQLEKLPAPTHERVP